MKKDDQIIYESIKKAHSQLEQAVSLFNELTDTTAIDYASYNLLAAQAQYSYLIQIAKERDLSL